MVVGVGTDILLVDRMRRVCADPDDPFLRKTYTERERAQARERDDSFPYYATRFAGKEAVFKSLGLDGRSGALREIEILSDDAGRPAVTLHGELRALAQCRGIAEVLISLSYDTDYATAFAIAQTD